MSISDVLHFQTQKFVAENHFQTNHLIIYSSQVLRFRQERSETGRGGQSHYSNITVQPQSINRSRVSCKGLEAGYTLDHFNK